MKRTKKLLSLILSCSLALSVPSQALAESAPGNTQSTEKEQQEGNTQQTPKAQPTKEIASVKVYTSADNDKNTPKEGTDIGISQETTAVPLGKNDNVATVQALDKDGNTLIAGQDFTVTSQAGQNLTYVQANGGIALQSEHMMSDEWKVYNAAGEEISTIALTEASNDFLAGITFTDIHVNDVVDVTLNSETGTKKYFRFTPEEAGNYSIYSSSCTNDSEVYIYDENGVQLYSNDDGGSGMNFSVSASLEAGKQYFIAAGTLDSSDSYQLHVVKQKGLSDLLSTAVKLDIADSDVTDGNAQPAETPVSTEQKTEGYYDQLLSFQPSQNGYYKFYVTLSEGNYLSEEPVILDSTGDRIAQQDSSSGYAENGRQYTASAYLTASQQYYIALEYEVGNSELACTSYVASETAVSGIQVSLKSEGSALVYGENGSFETYYDPDTEEEKEFFLFDKSSILSLFNITLIYEDGTKEPWEEYGSNRLSYSDNQHESHWEAGSQNNLMTLTADSIKKEIPVPVKPAPKATDITISLDTTANALVLGDTNFGYWNSYYNEETGLYDSYFYFDTYYIQRLYNITITYDNGATYENTLEDAVSSKKVTYTDNQSSTNPWQAGGENNLITVQSGDISKNINVPVKSFHELYSGCPELKEDTTLPVTYDPDTSNSGVLQFKPASDGTYYIYSSGTSDPIAELYDQNAKKIASDDDGYDETNFLISAELKAGNTYILKSRTYSKTAGSYNIIATRKKPANAGYSSLEGMDLSGKYINLALVVDTTGSMSDIISNVRDTLTEFVKAIAGTKATLRISLIDYRDIIEDGKESTVLHYSPSLSIWFENKDIDTLVEQIGSLGADGGGDEPESAVDALGNLVQPETMTFNASAAKFAFLVTDATYKEENQHGIQDMAEMIRLLQEKGIATSVITRKEHYSVYKDLTEKTNGTLINVEGDFSNAMGRFAARIAQGTEDYTPDTEIIPVESITLGKDLTVPAGKIKNFRPIFTPANATEKGVYWEIENPEIAKISENTTDGILVVQGIQEGKTKIIARSKDGGYTASFELTVTKSVYTDNKMESCDIDEILAELKDLASRIKDLIYYGDLKPDIAGDKQSAIYNAIKQTDKNILFTYSDKEGNFSYHWKFAGKDITNPAVSVAFGINVNDAASSTKQAADATKLMQYATFDFKHEGNLPGKANISAAIGAKFANGTYDLYYHNKGTGKLELCPTKATVSNGVAAFEITHCSSYVIGKTPAPQQQVTPTPTPKPDNNQKPTTDKKPVKPKKGTILKSGKFRYKVTKVGATAAFYKMSSATATVKIPDKVKINGITYKVTSISAKAFQNNKKLKKVTIGKNVTTIGDNAFKGCKKLTNATIGAGVKTIGKNAFASCPKLGKITIKSTKLTKIGKNAFKGIKSTAKIKVPSSKLKKYKKLLKGKGQGKKVKITK